MNIEDKTKLYSFPPPKVEQPKNFFYGPVDPDMLMTDYHRLDLTKTIKDIEIYSIIVKMIISIQGINYQTLTLLEKLESAYWKTVNNLLNIGPLV